MELPSQPLYGLIDGLAVLQYLAATAHETSGTEISRELEIEKTKVNRILKTLAYLGLVYRTAKRKYTLGPAIHILSAQTLYGSGLINHSIKHLIDLTDFDVMVAMGVLWRDKVSYIYHWLPGLAKTEGLGRMEVFPATQSSIGLILLSEKTDEQIREIIPDHDIPGYEKIEDLLADIQRFREQNFASTIFEGRTSVAVKIGHPAYAAIALADNEKDLLNEAYLSALREAVRRIESFRTLLI